MSSALEENGGQDQPVLSLEETADICGLLLDQLELAVVGKRPALELVLSGFLAGGHILLEDMPGLGKTLVARSLGQVTGLGVGRVQFTPDMMPADVTGSLLYDQRRLEFEFRPGPIFHNIVLGDEINRAPPKTQAALLEAMQERQVTVDGVSHLLPRPFVVLATQNPIELEGTYPLPEAQVDRFMLRTSLGYPNPVDEAEIVRRRLMRGHDEIELSAVVDRATVVALQAALETVLVSDPVIDYCVALVHATRVNGRVHAGASPRGVDALVKLGRGRAALAGRDYVTPDDIKAVAVPALAHRIVLRPEMWVRGVDEGVIIEEVLAAVATPPTLPPPSSGAGRSPGARGDGVVAP